MPTDEERIAKLLRSLPAAPEAWVQAAAAIPALHTQFDGLMERAANDPAFARALREDTEAAVRGSGIDASEPLVALLRASLAQD
jgi:hypothetical protein